MNTRMLSWSLVVLAGCSASLAPPGELVQSSKQRITQPAPQADVDQTVDSAVTFAFDVFRHLEGENLAFSPYSVATALSMTYPGARGATQTAFETTMHLALPAAQHHRAMNTVDAELQSRGEGASGTAGRPFALLINNQLFAQKGLTVLPDFLDVLAEEYGAGVRLMDFQAEPEPSRQAINRWVAHNTKDLIPELLPQGTITSDTALTLVNTLYFNAGWKKTFDHDATRPGSFTRSDGSVVSAQMMNGKDMEVGFGVHAGVDVLDLPYSGEEVSMTLLVPAVGQLATLEASLDGPALRTYLAALQPKSGISVRMPKFEVKTQARLDEVLKALGLAPAFGPDADFSGMTGSKGLALTAVVHESVVKTDEDGTEAAAATAVVVGRVSLPETIEVTRPFVYVIRDRATRAVLFIGRVENPGSTAS